MLNPYFLQGRYKRSRAPKPFKYGLCEDCGHAIKLHVLPYFQERRFPVGTCVRCSMNYKGEAPPCEYVAKLMKDAKFHGDVKKIGREHKKRQSEENE